MSNQLQENLNLILEEKNTKLLPENLKAGITCLGVTGELEGGLDTSDATATENDIVVGKTAYAKGKKIEGVIGEIASGELFTLDSENIEDRGDVPEMVVADCAMTKPTVLQSNSKIEMLMDYANLANAINLTSDKLVSGNTILGIEGTYVPPKPLSNVVPDSALVLMHLDGNNINAITGDAGNMPNVSIYRDPKFGAKSARAGALEIANITGVPTYTELTSGQAELTVSFWAYLKNTRGKLIFSAKQSTYNNTAFAIQQNDTTKLAINGSIIEIGDNLPSQWHHYGVMIKDGLLTVYFDGNEIYNGAISGSGTIPLRLRFGETDTAELRVDEILVCNEAIYSEDFIPLEEPYILPPKELTVNPTSTEQVMEGLYNKVTVAGDAELLPENIKSGVEIFGVTGTLTAGSEEKVEQIHNYLMLYDGSLGDASPDGLNVCSKITGGWELNKSIPEGEYVEGVGHFGFNSIYLEAMYHGEEYPTMTTFSTVNTINIEGYEKIGIILNSEFIELNLYVWNKLFLGDVKDCINTDTQTEYIVLDYPELPGAHLVSADLNTTNLKDFYVQGHISCTGLEGLAKSSIYGVFLVKQDDYQPILNLAGITETYDSEIAICENDIVISTILENEEAVDYIVHNCTGTFMLTFIQSPMCLDILNKSSYKTKFYGNEVWLKFLIMMSQEVKGMD